MHEEHDTADIPEGVRQHQPLHLVVAAAAA